MKQSKVIVLGGGLVGGPMAMDLAHGNEFDVTVADINPDIKNKFKRFQNIKTIQSDLSDQQTLKELVSNFDLVLSAVPGFMGFRTLKAIIEAGKNVIDIAFFPEDLFELDDLAKKHNVIAISDIGVAPGMSNLLTGYADSMLDKTEKVVIYVGGLPKVRQWPWEYKAVFSPVDVIEEYTRPARYIENGQEIVKPALTDPELLDFEGIGTLEAFNSDGLRSLAKTIKAGNMIEKTLRYPGHISFIKVLQSTGFFDTNTIEVNGQQVIPMDVTTALLFPNWKLGEGEEDITVMKVEVSGIKQGGKYIFTWNLFDVYDKTSAVHSMARTTGYTATMALRMINKGYYSTTGVSAPEFIGRDHACVNFILEGLKERGIVYKENHRKL
ncbi:MAG: saccharopine dehydrogenase NADP-binding domain-containing protein [Bacteroidales bacterium]|nr:saccharopine dehydrogenase NADP-binding domain-containing protein [Bacteroidales bacterium]